jgi:serine/threonine-protein kinase
VGQIVDRKYRVDRIIGEGGMAYVVAAYHLDLHTTVAIKILAPSLLANTEAVERFAREARAAARVVSQHVARVLDVGKLDTGAPYMVMEFLQGGDLAKMLEMRGRLPIAEAIDYLLQACEAIAEAHTLGIIHRDLKPANLFCVRHADGTSWIKVLDFGISKVTGPAANSGENTMTGTMDLLGSPFYMSPEQMESTRGVDARTDIWAMGVILYELLTGRVPFDGETIAEICRSIASGRPESVRDIRPEVSPALESVVFQCIEKDREKRYSDVGELALALGDFASPRGKLSVETVVRMVGQGQQARPPRVSNAELVPVASTNVDMEADTIGSLNSTSPRRVRVAKTKAAVAVAIGAILAFVAIVVFAFMHQPKGQERVGIGSSMPPAPPPPTLTREAPSVPTPQAPASASVPPSNSPPPTAETSNSATSVPARPAAAKRPPLPSVPAHPPHPNCDPNFILDAQGEKHFKAECFR